MELSSQCYCAAIALQQMWSGLETRLAWFGGASGSKTLRLAELTSDDIVHRARVGKCLEYEFRGTPLIHCEMCCVF
jgi:hypothetical protein